MEEQGGRLRLISPAGLLGELDITPNMTMGDLLLQLVLRFGKSLPVRLVVGKVNVHFAVGDRVMQVLSPLVLGLDGGRRSPIAIELTVVALEPNNMRPENTKMEGFQKITDSQWLWGGKGEGKCKPEKEGEKRGEMSEDQQLLEAWALDASVSGPSAVLSTFPFSALMGLGFDFDDRYIHREKAGTPGSHGEDKITRESILYSAVRKGDETSVRLLIECHAEVNNPQAFDMYLPGYNAKQIKQSVLYAAVQGGHVNICRILLESKACADNGLTKSSGERPWEMSEKTVTPLYAAAEKKAEKLAIELCSILLDYNANPNEGVVDAESMPGPEFGSVRWMAERNSPASVANSDQCKKLLEKASGLWPCCDAAWRGWLCPTCGTQR